MTNLYRQMETRRFIREIDGLDDQGIALPRAPGTAIPLTDIVRQVGPSISRYDASIMDHLGHQKHMLRRLDDTQDIVVNARGNRWARIETNKATLRQAE